MVLWETGFLDSAALALHEIQAFQLPSQPPDARQAVCATRANEPGELLQAMRTAHAKPCQRTADELPTGGFTLSTFGARDRVLVAGWGRPELENYTPVNIGNGPYRDNGEGVAATPLPYPLERGHGSGKF